MSRELNDRYAKLVSAHSSLVTETAKHYEELEQYKYAVSQKNCEIDKLQEALEEMSQRVKALEAEVDGADEQYSNVANEYNIKVEQLAFNKSVLSLARLNNQSLVKEARKATKALKSHQQTESGTLATLRKENRRLKEQVKRHKTAKPKVDVSAIVELQKQLKETREVLKLANIYVGFYEDPKGVQYLMYDRGVHKMQFGEKVGNAHQVLVMNQHGQGKLLYRPEGGNEVLSHNVTPERRFNNTKAMRDSVMEYMQSFDKARGVK